MSPASIRGSEPSVAATSITTASSAKRLKKYTCEFAGCDKAFDRPARLEIHLRSHTNERPYACTEDGCDKTFLRSEHLKAHVKSKHNDDRDYVCSYSIGTNDDGCFVECGKTFHTGTRLRRHIAAHEEKEQTKCQECGKIFRKQETLQRHIKSDHLSQHAFRCEHADDDGSVDGSAEECGVSFATAGQLRAHQSREHSGLRYFCDICASPQEDVDMIHVLPPVSFASYLDLQDHIKTEHLPTCATCGHVCDTNRALRAHMDIEHSSLSDRQRFECDQPGCDRKFTKKGNLKVHIQTVHAKAKSFVCGQHDLSKSNKIDGWTGAGCGMSFGTKGSLEGHIRTQHLGISGTPHSSSKAKSGKTDRPRSRNAHGLPSTVGKATSNLTGFAYEETRPLACLEQSCPHRFSREYDLATHLELQHGWNIDDVNDCLGGAALGDDKFWIGADEGFDGDPDEILRQRLVESLLLEGDGMVLDDGTTASPLFEDAAMPDFQADDMLDPRLSSC